MAKNVLPVDFQDDILAESMNGRRKYQMITNSDGTVSFVDVTEYTQVGSNFGQAQVNATNEAVNESADKNKIIDDKDDLVANSQAGMMAGALAVKAIREELTQNKIKYAILSVTTNGARTQSVQQSDANQIIAATFVQNDDIYNMCAADNIYPSVQIMGTKVIQILYMNKTPKANTRTLQILVAYM